VSIQPGQAQGIAEVPAGAIEHQHGMGLRRQRLAQLGQHQVHGHCVGLGQDQSHGCTTFGADGAEQLY
jgi:hypothetical protein